MNILAEVTIDETGIIKQMDAVKEAADKFEDEALKLRWMLAQIKATANIKVNSISEAWRTAARIFPTDYEKNEDSSKRAGYPIYETTSTDERFSGFHISDLNTRLEVNMGNETVTIWIEEDAFEIVVKGLTEDEKESLKEVVDKEIRRIKYRRHKAETSNLRYVIDLNS